MLFTRGGLAYHTNAADLEPVEHNGWPLTAGRRDDSDKLPAQYEVLVSIDPSDGRSSAE